MTALRRNPKARNGRHDRTNEGECRYTSENIIKLEIKDMIVYFRL